MSAMEPAVTREYHKTNMPRRDPISQAILNRKNGKHGDDEFASKLPEMNPETAKHFSSASEALKQITNDLVPKLVGRLNELEKSQKHAEELAIKRDKEINEKFDALMSAIAGATKAPKKGKPQKVRDEEDFQEETDGLPPAEQ